MIRIVVSSSCALCWVCFLYRNFLYLIVIIPSFLSLVALGSKFPGHFLVKRTEEKTLPLVKDQSLLGSKIFYLHCMQKCVGLFSLLHLRGGRVKVYFFFCPGAATIWFKKACNIWNLQKNHTSAQYRIIATVRAEFSLPLVSSATFHTRCKPPYKGAVTHYYFLSVSSQLSFVGYPNAALAEREKRSPDESERSVTCPLDLLGGQSTSAYTVPHGPAPLPGFLYGGETHKRQAAQCLKLHKNIWEHLVINSDPSSPYFNRSYVNIRVHQFAPDLFQEQ